MFVDKLFTLGFWLFQEAEGVAFDPINMWRMMGWPAG